MFQSDSKRGTRPETPSNTPNKTATHSNVPQSVPEQDGVPRYLGGQGPLEGVEVPRYLGGRDTVAPLKTEGGKKDTGKAIPLYLRQVADSTPASQGKGTEAVAASPHATNIPAPAAAPSSSHSDVTSSGTEAGQASTPETTSLQVTTAGAPPSAGQVTPAPPRLDVGMSGPTGGLQSPATAGVDSPEYEVFLQQVQSVRGGLTKATTGRRQRITDGADAQKQSIKQLVEQEAVRLEGFYDDALKAVRSALQNARTEVEANREVKITATRTAAQTELKRLGTVEHEGKKAMQRVAREKAAAATDMGEREAQRAIDGSRARAGRAQQIKQAKIKQLQNVKDGERLAADVERRVTDLVQEFTKTGSSLATMARERAGKAAGHITAEAAELVTTLGDRTTDARTEIIKCRDETITALQDQAQTSLNHLQDEADELVTKLQSDKLAKCAQVRANAEAIAQGVDESVTRAHQKVDREAERIAGEITRFVDKIAEVKWAGTQLESAGSDLTRAVDEHNKEQDRFADDVINGIKIGITSAVADLGEVVTGQGKVVTTTGSDFETEAAKACDKVIGKLEDVRKEGADKIAEPASQVEEKFQRGVERAGDEWDRQLKTVEDGISRDVNDGLRQQDDAVAALSSSLEGVGSEARSFVSGLVDAIVDFASFIAGVVVGMLEHVWDLLKDLWELVKKPLFWVVVAILVVIAIVVIVFFGWAALVAALAFIGKVLLVVGIVIGLGAAIYYLYQAATQPDLSPYQRGKLVGKAIDEVILAFLGTGVWSKLGGWIARVSRIAAFLDKVGNVIKAARVLRRVRDVEVAIRLMEEIKDAEAVLRCIDEIKDAETVLVLWRAVGSTDDILKLWAEIKDADAILKLWAGVKDADVILKLWAEIKDADVILKLWAGVQDADVILKLWAEIKDADAIIKLWAGVKDADVILRLWAKIKNADLIVRLWDKLADANKLIKLFDEVKDGEMLLRLLEKVTDVSQLERLLSKVDKAADLDKLLKDMSAQEIEDFITELGNLDLFKDLARKYGGDALKFYGAQFFKNFKGVDADSMKHLMSFDGLDKVKGIKGCHDEAMFLAEMAKPPDGVVSPPAGATRGPILSSTPHPSDPEIQYWKYSFWQQDGKGKLVTPLTPKAKDYEKTTIRGLIANAAKWQASAMEAVEDAIKTLQFPKGDASFSGTAKNGLGWSGWYRDGKIQTVFPVLP